MTDLKFTSPSGETTIKLEGTGRLGTVAPKTQLHIKKMDEPVQYETPMTENEEEIEKVKAQIKVLEKKLSFLEELEKTKTPCEEAFKKVYGHYPVDKVDDTWFAFVSGYNAAQKDYKVGEWEPTLQTPEQVADGLKEAFREAVKQGVVSSSTKQKTLYGLIEDWWSDVFTTSEEMEVCIDNLVNSISEWLPTEHDTNSYKWNECIRLIREKLR